MAEVGCLKDGNLQNLDVNGNMSAPQNWTGGGGSNPSQAFISGRNSIDIASSSTTPLYPLGTRLEYGDNVYRYAKAGGNIGSALMVHARAIDEGDIAVQASFTAGGKTISITAATTITANTFDEGYLIITKNNGNSARSGGAFRVKSHSAGSGTQTVTLYDPVNVGLTTSCKVTLIANKYSGVILAAATITAEIIGVTPVIKENNNQVAANDYFWLQTHGICGIVSQDRSDLAEIGQGAYYLVAGTPGNINSFN